MLAIVWRRTDFRESSRVVTLLSRERGRFQALAKGAHRPNSALLGRLDFLNQVDVRVSGRGMPLLGRTRLVHEPRALREPLRFLVAAHLTELLDAAHVPDRADPDLFDLTLGAVVLVERARPAALGRVVAGVELRLLRALGQLGDLGACAVCGATGELAAAPREGGLYCREHRPPGAVPPGRPALEALRRLAAARGREWPGLPPLPGLDAALAVLGGWIVQALETLPRFRAAALRACAARSGRIE